MHNHSALTAESLQLGGFVPMSCSDWPDMLAAVVFIAGCPWRCSYCHNPHLHQRDEATAHATRQLLKFLESRQGLLDGVVFSGGEPTIDPALPAVIQQVKAMGFKVGLHTAGCYPDRLIAMLPDLDWVGLDIKTLPEQYDALTAISGSGQRAVESLDAVIEAGIRFEVRTTIHPDWLPEHSITQLADWLAGKGVRHFALQRYRPSSKTPPPPPPMTYPDLACLAYCEKRFESFTLRNSNT
ncbi:anaerobic ribonucleoside-triphosphate reductase activating protein [Leeia oryzae]|uniref:anaerobic ribonucleoside-triphosphate reductase activating protein n=1 Tax=Leeia oryzae TaxID=356662 RepID=UPI0003719EF8|nr:anaerobic ribonucleoside-triphosphate reductase activating protein [Leeia oryzae]